MRSGEPEVIVVEGRQRAVVPGARVIGAARGKQKLNLAEELGADAVVDYSLSRWPGQVLAVTGGAGADLVVDGVGGEIGRAAFEVTARGGQGARIESIHPREV